MSVSHRLTSTVFKHDKRRRLIMQDLNSALDRLDQIEIDLGVKHELKERYGKAALWIQGVDLDDIEKEAEKGEN